MFLSLSLHHNFMNFWHIQFSFYSSHFSWILTCIISQALTKFQFLYIQLRYDFAYIALYDFHSKRHKFGICKSWDVWGNRQLHYTWKYQWLHINHLRNLSTKPHWCNQSINKKGGRSVINEFTNGDRMLGSHL